MMYPHQDSEFESLIMIVASNTGLGEAVIEKDYWVTHTLWALHQLSLEIWFKGGTSLSKGFGLISRFSEDVDLRIDPGLNASLDNITNWRSSNKGIVKLRRHYFDTLERILEVPDVTIEIAQPRIDDQARAEMYLVHYPGVFLQKLPPNMRPYIQLEVGYARVEPNIERSLSSYIHDRLIKTGQIDEYQANNPETVRCLHPVVTLIEKIDAIIGRYNREQFDPVSFIRHYEDAAHIILARNTIPALEMSVHDLVMDMFHEKQIRKVPTSQEAAFLLDDSYKLESLLHHYHAISPMFWGDRIALEDACTTIREWIHSELE